MTIEIYFSDLTAEKQQELTEAGFYHENIDLTPVAIIEQEDEQGEAPDNENVRDWYMYEYPTDEAGKFIKKDLTFETVYCNLEADNIYKVVFEEHYSDSLIRERIFEKIAEIKDVPYDNIYKKWLDA